MMSIPALLPATASHEQARRPWLSLGFENLKGDLIRDVRSRKKKRTPALVCSDPVGNWARCAFFVCNPMFFPFPIEKRLQISQRKRPCPRAQCAIFTDHYLVS